MISNTTKVSNATNVSNTSKVSNISTVSNTTNVSNTINVSNKFNVYIYSNVEPWRVPYPMYRQHWAVLNVVPEVITATIKHVTGGSVRMF